MPYIALKAYPKDDETKKSVIEQFNEIFLKTCGCPQEAITISIEEILPEEWKYKVKVMEIDSKQDRMMILDGQKMY